METKILTHNSNQAFFLTGLGTGLSIAGLALYFLDGKSYKSISVVTGGVFMLFGGLYMIHNKK